MSAAARKAKAGRELARLAKGGIAVAPIRLEGRTIVRTFWGKAWCENLESYSDFSNRLPRGRPYVRNGSVLDLQIVAGQVNARVQGSSLYQITIKIKPLESSIWTKVQTACSGKIQSLLELLQGRLSESVMQVVTNQKDGLFPKPAEIRMECSCPDWAGMCKHIAASLYGVGARLDAKPELLFLLRGVDPAELIVQAATAGVVTGAPESSMSNDDLSAIFGIEMETENPATNPFPSALKKKSKKSAAREPVRGTERITAKGTKGKPRSASPKGKARPAKKAGLKRPSI